MNEGSFRSFGLSTWSRGGALCISGGGCRGGLSAMNEGCDLSVSRSGLGGLCAMNEGSFRSFALSICSFLTGGGWLFITGGVDVAGV
jgi:hypothetical protein